MVASRHALPTQVLWSSVQGPNASNATVLQVNITNSTKYWTVTFPADGRQPINVLCHAPSCLCPLSSAPSCVSAPPRNSTSRKSSLLSTGNASTCVAGTAFNASQRYGLRVSCPSASSSVTTFTRCSSLFQALLCQAVLHLLL